MGIAIFLGKQMRVY